MTEEQKITFKRIDDILWFDWDPIGVNDIEDARDEYQSYTPEIFELKIKGADRSSIANRLNEIAVDRMGLLGNIEHCIKIADRIVAV